MKVMAPAVADELKVQLHFDVAAEDREIAGQPDHTTCQKKLTMNHADCKPRTVILLRKHFCAIYNLSCISLNIHCHHFGRSRVLNFGDSNWRQAKSLNCASCRGG